MTDDQLFRVHWWADWIRRVSVAAFAGFAWVALMEDWPKWALWLTVAPTAAAVVVTCLVVVPVCRWLEGRRGWEF